MKLSLLLLLLSLFAISYCITNTKSQDPLNPNFLSLRQDFFDPELEASINEKIASGLSDTPVSETIVDQYHEEEASDSDAPEQEIEVIHKVENNEETDNEETDEQVNEETKEEAHEEDSKETNEEDSEETAEEQEETEEVHEVVNYKETDEEETNEEVHEEASEETIEEEEETEEINEEENNEETDNEEVLEEVGEAGASEPVHPVPASVWTEDASVDKDAVAEEGWELLDEETIKNSTVIQQYVRSGAGQAIAEALDEGKIINDYYFVRRINRVERQNVVNANNEVIESTYRLDLDLSNGKGTNVAVKFEVEYNEATQEGELKDLEYHAKVL